MHYFTQNITMFFLGMGHRLLPDTIPAGQRDIPFQDPGHSAVMVPQLYSFGAASSFSATWSRHVGGLSPLTVKILATSLFVVHRQGLATIYLRTEFEISVYRRGAGRGVQGSGPPQATTRTTCDIRINPITFLC